MLFALPKQTIAGFVAANRLGWRPPWDLPAAIDATVDWNLAVRDGRDPLAVSLEQIERFSAEARAGRALS